ncbi:MAG: glycosylasparaginase [Planctomycetaceae bacterium]|nr:glycosylasparaginase [Planctomycetaceae bacterium]
MKRRKFLATGSVWGATSVIAKGAEDLKPKKLVPGATTSPMVISTWDFGVRANKKAIEVLATGGTALDAVQQGVMVVESDPTVTSVGYGGLPNAAGVVELDASIMDGSDLECGAVAGLSGFENPISVARKVMEETPHVLIVGSGARQFALSKGFQERDLLTEQSRKAWQAWRANQKEKRQIDDHDTIGMVAVDQRGQMAAACTTSGLAWKIPGRVGDSPLVGHGLYCDSDVGGAAATGIGEEIVKVCGSYQVVEYMRQGVHPQDAVKRVLQRVLDRQPDKPDRWVGFVALRRDGEVGYASTNTGFQVAVADLASSRLIVAASLR